MGVIIYGLLNPYILLNSLILSVNIEEYGQQSNELNNLIPALVV